MSTGELSAGGTVPVEVLQDRAAIADLIHTYTFKIRQGEGHGCTELFAPSATFEIRDARAIDRPSILRNRLEGRDAIVAHISHSAQKHVRVCPMIHNLLIEVNGKSATSSALMVAISRPAGNELLGEYQDTFTKDDGWRFASRIFSILQVRPAASGPAIWT